MTRYITLGEFFWLAEQVTGIDAEVLTKASRSVTRNGRPSFVLMSPDDLESLEETLDIVRDEDLMNSLRQSREEAGRGERLPLEENT